MEGKKELDVDKVLHRHKKYYSEIPVMQAETEEIVAEIQQLTKLDKRSIREIIVTQFRFVTKVASECKLVEDEDFNPDDYKSVRLTKLGRFELVNAFRKKHKE